MFYSIYNKLFLSLKFSYTNKIFIVEKFQIHMSKKKKIKIN